MLHLQRASAGSGKTYALAKTFIRLLISIRDEGGRRRLRSDSEIADAAGHILAVTFTNKATNEMQQRIVSNLAALAFADPAAPPADTDYLSDFIKEFDAPQKLVSDVCLKALRALLLGYSGFNVSTIDSFFQTILRTFAYETDLNDAYNLEIDNDYVASVGLDSLLDAIASDAREDDDTLFWIRYLMGRQADSTGWNPFQRNSRRRTLYNTLARNTANLEKEQFKEIHDSFNRYFENHGSRDLRQLMQRLDSKEEELLSLRAKSATALKQAFADLGLDVATQGAAYLDGRIKKALAGNAEFDMSEPKQTPGISLATKSRKGIMAEKSAADIARLDELYFAFYESHRAIAVYRESDFFKVWRLYRTNIPYLALLHKVAAGMQAFLDSTNTLQISDTNTLLRRIIGDRHDAPFVYERIGTRINHFLIDEFQDTSSMQWHIFEPLLEESLATDNDNLIIGDAKQSIYRFRNADPSLISSVVPRKFRHDDSADPAPADGSARPSLNTNWRSALKIIEWNNDLFRQLSAEFTCSLRDLYDNCVQPPSPKAVENQQGYVELHIAPASPKENADEDEQGDADSSFVGYRELGPLVSRLLERGFRLNDIGILVITNEQGEAVVETLSEYNASLPPGSRMIEFISDQSLKVADSTAVSTIVAALATLCDGNPEVSEKAPAPTIDTERLYALTARLQSLALPVLVEAVAEEFVDQKLRQTDARYMAAFLDAVMEYADTGNADIASFLDWWNRKKKSLSVSSPEDADAVRIVTVHKAKGLEYSCVIMPEARFSFGPGPMKKEWVWIRPDREYLARTAAAVGIDPAMTEGLPPVLPVATSRKDMEQTPYAHIWRGYQESVCQDSLNLAYVAFTRAVNELYIYCPQPARDSMSAPCDDKESGEILPDVSSALATYLRRYFTGEDDDFRYGSPLSAEEIAALHRRHDSKKDSRERDELLDIDCYYVTRTPAQLDYRPEESSHPGDGMQSTPDGNAYEEPADETDPVDDETDPRSEGSLLHAVMEHVRVPSDLEKALKRSVLRGIITSAQADQWHPFLRKAIENADNSFGWFDPGMKVLSERALLCRGFNRRPDRIVVSPEGDATVIDYKFGAKTNVREYERQVGRYVEAARACGLFRSVRGFLWYLREGVVGEVTPDAKKQWRIAPSDRIDL